ncbi:hypothetical protein BDP81DRAFT_32621 [Colletotrichum phormii]|uniref:Uncharacterized protein n=1 Tax=Colletotrichum phormii TaxID=359342 RepID=A0AAJ0EGG4_9PEZI|nr:uncharacterized protein BDP81DRAFT_32621 [Colletotrichum phormii]KAK1636026.1 hypothetical protein BDP81DRAFT_32621 [Colletotrichum phormii]
MPLCIIPLQHFLPIPLLFLFILCSSSSSSFRKVRVCPSGIRISPRLPGRNVEVKLDLRGAKQHRTMSKALSGLHPAEGSKRCFREYASKGDLRILPRSLPKCPLNPTN